MPSNSRKPISRGNPALFERRARAVRSANTEARLSDSDSETSLSPIGSVAKSNAHFVPRDARVHVTQDAIEIIGADGDVIHSTPLPKAVDTQTPALASTTVSATIDGWNAYTKWENDSDVDPISHFRTTWDVPADPTNYDSQTLFIFNSLEPATTGILQPVLQYGPSAAGGGQYWSIASWYLYTDTSDVDHAYYTTLIEVSSGDPLTGIMNMIDADDTHDYWKCSFDSYSDSSLKIGTAQELIYATETLETYNSTGESDLPTGTTNMEDIYLKLKTGGYPTLTWEVYNDAADSISINVVKDGSNGGEVDIVYPS